MLHVLCLLLFVLSNADSVSDSVVFSTPGENATVTYKCSLDWDCYGLSVRWIRITSNGSLQIIDTECKKSPCRFTYKTLNNAQAELTIAQTEPGDSGRYFGGEHHSSNLHFDDVGPVLQVGETANGFVDPVPIVFGEIGRDVTIQSRVKNVSSLYMLVTWYHQRPGGRVKFLGYFSSYATQMGRYTAAFCKGTNSVSLTIANTKTDDSGWYFAVMRDSETFTSGITSILAITDPEIIPVLRVFRSHAGTFMCELKGGGPPWSDPRWEMEDGDGRTRLSQPEAESFLDEQGAFIQSSILSLDDGFRGLNCSTRHSNGAIISQLLTLYTLPGQKKSHHLNLTKQIGDSECPWVWFVSPLCVLLCLVMVTVGWLWARRLRMQTHTTQEMENNGGT